MLGFDIFPGSALYWDRPVQIAYRTVQRLFTKLKDVAQYHANLSK